MEKFETLPDAFTRYRQIGGVLEFSVFEHVKPDERSSIAAIAIALPGIDIDKLTVNGNKCVSAQGLFGDWYDPNTNALVLRGRHRTDDGKEWIDPRLSDLGDRRIVSGGSPIPEAGLAAQLAYAFSQPPYGLQAKPSEVQALFLQIRDFVLAPSEDHEILDWTSPTLPDASPYFLAGMEWWGICLATIQTPALARITVIAASSTD